MANISPCFVSKDCESMTLLQLSPCLLCYLV